MLKKNKGITLIALVLTIIILIILAGVSISLIGGPNGIIDNAQEAKEKTRGSQIKEAVELASLTNALETDANKKTKASIIEELKAKGQLTDEEEAQLVESDTITIGGIEIDFSILEGNGTPGQTNVAEVAIPTLSDTNKTYTGAEQTPTISGYNSEYVTQTGDAAATDVGTYTIKWNLKDTTNSKWSDGTTEEKSATWTIGKTALKNVVTAVNYGDSVAYSVTVNGVTLNNWKIFYNDGTNVIMIYNDYLPNTTGIATSAGLETDGDYGVYSNTDRADLINKLNDTSKWTSLIRSDLAGKATAKGALDLETWVASWNAKGYTRLYTAKDTGMSDSIGWGYNVGTSENPTNYWQDLYSDAGYNDTLYFPYTLSESGCEGYWIASPSAIDPYYVMSVYCSGGADGDGYVGYDSSSYSCNGACPAVYLTSDVLTSGKDASGNWVIE